MKKFEIRTDLALEVNEQVNKETGNLKGIIVDESKDDLSGIKVTTLKITNKRGEKILGKPVGTYVTIEAEKLSSIDDEYNKRTAAILAGNIRLMMDSMLKDIRNTPWHVLVAGLGNRDVTADSLGPDVVENLMVNRHIKYAEDSNIIMLSGLSPGVMAQTGMETAEIIKGIVRETKPDIVIAIDALAARSCKRLNTTIQLSDRGIHPGSGVGNHRIGITKESIGVPVLAIGVPTVIDAPTIVNDAINNLVGSLSQTTAFKPISDILYEYSDDEKYQLVKEIIDTEMADMYVTPKDVDANIKVIGYTLSEAINIVTQNKSV